MLVFCNWGLKCKNLESPEKSDEANAGAVFKSNNF